MRLASVRNWVVALGCAAVAASGLAAVPAGADVAAPAACPDQEVLPVHHVENGMMLRGLTVSRGTESEPFAAEVLGVLKGGVGPGRDLIVVEVDSPAIDKVGGIWAGMSGSPVYTESGALVGAIAYGFSYGPSKIGGVTPAEDMIEIFDYESSSASTAGLRSTSSKNGKVALSKGMKARVARRTGVSASEVGNMSRLRVPFSISGLSAHGMRKVRRLVKRENLPLIPHAGGGTTSISAAAEGIDPIDPGDSFAATISIGDVTAAGVGTATMVCDGRILAFGHSFFGLPVGKTSMGGAAAEAVAVVDDPVFGSFKLANVTSVVGTVDQDRWAGIGAVLGDIPRQTSVESVVISPSNSRTRTGSSSVFTSQYAPFVTFLHLLGNIDMTFDQVGPGSAQMMWTFSGTTADGSPWTLTRSNMYADKWDISYFSLFEIEGMLYSLYHNRFEKIEFGDIDATVTVEPDYRLYRVRGLQVSKNGSGFAARRSLRVRRGDRIVVRALLRSSQEGAEDTTVQMRFRVPRNAKRSGHIEIGGGRGEGSFCFVDWGSCTDEAGNKITTFDTYLEALENAPHNNDLIGRMRMGRLRSSKLRTLDQVVRGRKTIWLELAGARREE